MLALGSCLLGSALLIAGLLARSLRNPNAPRWTRPEIVPMVLCIPVTGMMGFGLAWIALGLHQLLNGTVDLIGLRRPLRW